MLLSQANFLHSASTCLIGRYLGWPAAFLHSSNRKFVSHTGSCSCFVLTHTTLCSCTYICCYAHANADIWLCGCAYARCEPACCPLRVAFLLWHVGVKQHATPGIRAIRNIWNHGNHASFERISKSMGKKWRRGEQLEWMKRSKTFHVLQEEAIEQKKAGWILFLWYWI